jgi:carbohydrate esterase-like sialic acid-specific acetylesterase
VAQGGTALTVGSTAPWKSGNPGGSLYENAIAQANAALAAAQAIRPGSFIKGIGWLQGESDLNVAQATYATALDAVIAGFRSRMTGAASAWFSVLGMLPEYIATSNNNVNAAHIDTPNRNARCTFTAGTSGNSNGDALHYNAAGQRILGAAWAGSVVGL